jgi:hypothetical protein
VSEGKGLLYGGGAAILTMAPKRIERNFGGDLPKPSSVSSLIEVSPSAFNETADE